MRALNVLGINEGFVKILVLLINILFLNHLVACGWHFLAKFDNYSPDTWVARNNLVGAEPMLRYSAGMYKTIWLQQLFFSLS